MAPPAAANERVTVPELGRRMARIEEDFKHGLEGLHRRLDELKFVHPETLDTKLLLEQAHRMETDRRVAMLEAADQRREDQQAANRRLAVTGLVLPLLVAVIGALVIASTGIR